MLANLDETPLPPYVRRAANPQDASRYQTVYARNDGAVAAPTAGLHFDETLLDALQRSGVGMAFVTLYIGAGTFSPLREHRLDNNRLHSEWMRVPETTMRAVHKVRKVGGRVLSACKNVPIPARVNRFSWVLCLSLSSGTLATFLARF